MSEKRTEPKGFVMAARIINEPWEISKEEEEEGFVPLFNGVDLEGWHVVVRQHPSVDAWSVSDGVLVCNGEGRGWIRPKREYENFVLRLEYKISPGGNSGVFIRTTEEGRPAYQGMEIQILDDQGKEPTKKSTGAIYDAVAPKRNMSKPAGEWNQMEIGCLGRQVRVWMNGEQIVDVDLDEYPELRSRLPRGYIGLQNHGVPVEFRNVRIKEL